MPYPRNEHFTGREQMLADLHAALRPGNATALTQAISGLGGIGKTQTALEYAYRFGHEYAAVFWLRADSAEEVRQSLATTAARLGLPEKDAQDVNLAVAAAQRWLAQNPGWLLIADNADFTATWTPADLKRLLPYPLQGSLLLTSRAQYFGPLGIAHPLELHKMTPAEADDFLWQRVGRERAQAKPSEREAARQTAEALDYLPLALEQAGAYIAAKQKQFASYRDEFGRRAKELLAEAHPEIGEYHPDGPTQEYRTAWTTWDLNFRAVRKESEAAAELLRASAFLAPDAIPAELFIKGASELEGALAAAFAADRDGMEVYDDLLEPLTRYSLIRKDIENATYAMHRLVQQVLRERLSEAEQKEVAKSVVLAVNLVFPRPEFPAWSLCGRLLPHALLCAEYIADYDLRIAQATLLLTNMAWYLRERARYGEAEPLYREALAICRQLHGEEHQNVAAALNNLAMLYRDTGRYAEAASHLEQAGEIDRKTIGEDHPDYASHLDNLGGVYYSQHRFEEAAALGEQALEITRRTLGAEHPQVAIGLNNLANVYSDMGRYTEAVSLLEEALAIGRKTRSEDHPGYATCLCNLARVYVQWERPAEAGPLLLQALSIREQALGKEHPRIADCHFWLGQLRHKEGKREETADHFRHALEILERTLGPQHQETVKIRKWVALVG